MILNFIFIYNFIIRLKSFYHFIILNLMQSSLTIFINPIKADLKNNTELFGTMSPYVKIFFGE